MIGGHYVAYVLVDPGKMFEQGQEVVDAIKDLSLDRGSLNVPSYASDGVQDNRVWCFCSE